MGLIFQFLPLLKVFSMNPLNFIHWCNRVYFCCLSFFDSDSHCFENCNGSSGDVVILGKKLSDNPF